jgi:hypothetical protein
MRKSYPMADSGLRRKKSVHKPLNGFLQARCDRRLRSFARQIIVQSDGTELVRQLAALSRSGVTSISAQSGELSGSAVALARISSAQNRRLSSMDTTADSFSASRWTFIRRSASARSHPTRAAMSPFRRHLSPCRFAVSRFLPPDWSHALAALPLAAQSTEKASCRWLGSGPAGFMLPYREGSPAGMQASAAFPASVVRRCG